MSTPNLDQIVTTLVQLDVESILTSLNMPIDTFLAEAETLGQLLAVPDVGDRLKTVGVEADRLTIFPVAVEAAREAQAFWTQVKGLKRAEELEAVAARGKEVRAEMLQACDWNLRNDRDALDTLRRIREGDGTADLAQDLHALASLVDSHRSAFDRDQTFDAPAMAAEAREVARTLMGEQAAHHHAFKNSEAKNIRDRAFTYLDELVREIREAGTYAYRRDDAMARRFASAYWRKKNRAVQSHDEPETPAEPAEPAEPAQPAPADAE